MLGSRAKGNLAEEKAVTFLIRNGFRVLERNFSCKVGELDIIAQKEGVLHFVEVKSGENFEAIYNLTPQKLQRVLKTTQFYLKKTGLDMPFSIDAIVVQKEEIEHLENITL